MKKKLFCIPLLLSVLFSACGFSHSDRLAQEQSAQYAGMEEVEYSAADVGAANDIYSGQTKMAGEAGVSPEGAPTADPSAELMVGANDLAARKMIRNANMTVETEGFDTLLVAVEEKVAGLGGYMENYSTSKNSSYYGGSANRYANMTIRIPYVKYDQFVNEIAVISNVLDRNESIQDVTLQYVDLESHKKVLRAEQERLLELLDEAKTIEDIIAIESRLSEVRYQIESMESQLRIYDNLIDYSTIYLNIQEVVRLTPVQEQSAWEKISTGFVRSWENLGTGAKEIFIWLMVMLPYFMILAVMVAIPLFIIKLCVGKKGRKKNKNESESKPESKPQ